MAIKQKKTIAIVATGGTIAGTGEVGKTAVYHAGEMNVESILETIPMLQNVADIETVQLLNVDSNEMDEEKWITLANQLNDLAAREDIDGIVVTHGTDTLDETAYFLNLTVYTSRWCLPERCGRQRRPVQTDRLICIRQYVWQLVMMPGDKG